MLEDCFVVPAAARLRACLCGAHLDTLCASLAALGYRRFTIRQKVWTIAGLSRWMATQHLSLGALDERRVAEFLVTQRRRSHRRRGMRSTLLQLLKHLRDAGVVPALVCPGDASPSAALLARYEDYLRRERALCATTITAYRQLVRAFVEERLSGPAAGPDALRVSTDFRGGDHRHPA